MALQTGIAPGELLDPERTPPPVFNAMLRRLAEQADDAQRAELQRHLRQGL